MTTDLLLDTSSLAYRAFFALPTSITDHGGRPVNAVRGYLDMVANLVTHLAPAAVQHVFDHDWRPAARVAAYPGYKADRAPDPPDLPWQFTLLRQVLAALGQPVVEAPGWEADDALGTLAAAAGPDDRVAIVTGDRDLLQLVRDPVVRVLFTLRGVRRLATYDEAGVCDKYGLPPGRYVDFAILRGDPSDGLPGVRGVGEKTARDLVTRYPTLAALLDDVDAQTPRLAASLRAAREYLDAMRAVVPVRTDVALETQPGQRDDGALAELVSRHRLDGSVQRLAVALDG